MPHSPITAGTKVVYQEGVYTVRAVDGNVLELAYHTGDFFRLVHASSVLVCPPPATQTAASLPAPAAGQGVGASYPCTFLTLLAFMSPCGNWRRVDDSAEQGVAPLWGVINTSEERRA